MSSATLKGRLLVALPALRDGNFDRTVVYMIEHNDDGAVGVVLNRPSELRIDEPLPAWTELAPNPKVVFVGGPVGTSGAIGLAETGGELTTVDLGEEPAALDMPVDRMRVFAGYAGWGAGQLEDEIAALAWVVVDSAPGDVMTDDPERLWSRVLRRQGGRLGAVAAFPLDPTSN